MPCSPHPASDFTQEEAVSPLTPVQMTGPLMPEAGSITINLALPHPKHTPWPVPHFSFNPEIDRVSFLQLLQQSTTDPRA